MQIPNNERRSTWENKPTLRALYSAYADRLIANARPGNILEIGGGVGNLKETVPGVISMDIVATSWIDLVGKAERIPFRQEYFDNIVLIDVLHHLGSPGDFFAESLRVLRPKGRVILIEPAITALSGMFYRNLHPEPVDMSVDPFAPVERKPERDAHDANQAIPTLIFFEQIVRFRERFPGFNLLRREYFDLLGLPLSGGFRKWSLLPSRLVGPLINCEKYFPDGVKRFAAFRLFVVLEKSE